MYVQASLSARAKESVCRNLHLQSKGKVYGSNGSTKTPGENPKTLRGPNSIKKWRRKLLFFFYLLVSIVLKELLDQSCGLPLIQLIIF